MTPSVETLSRLHRVKVVNRKLDRDKADDRLNPPALPERRESGVRAQPDDIEDVKKVCTKRASADGSCARWDSLEASSSRPWALTDTTFKRP